MFTCMYCIFGSPHINLPSPTYHSLLKPQRLYKPHTQAPPIKSLGVQGWTISMHDTVVILWQLHTQCMAKKLIHLDLPLHVATE